MQTLAERVGVSLDDPAAGIDADIVARARSGDRIGAARLYAERTGAGFVQA